MLRMHRRVFTLGVALVLSLPVFANPLLPGGHVTPDVFTINSTPPLLEDVTGTFDVNGFKGSYEMIVAVDPFGVTCAGCLDFAFQVYVDAASTNPLINLTFSNLFNYATDVGYVDGSGDKPPNDIGRSANGSFVGFAFTNQDTFVPPDDFTMFVIIATNAKTYDSNGQVQITGFVQGAPNKVARIAAFEPTAPTPEPGTMALLSLGFGGMTFFYRRRK